MAIDDKIDSEEPIMNCFECDGVNDKCGTYWAFEESICLYKKMANKDIKKYLAGMDDLALEQMFNEYRETLRLEYGKNN